MTTISRKIYVFVVPRLSLGPISGQALCEDGVLLGHALSKGIEDLRYELLFSIHRLKSYRDHCPAGYELVWVDDPCTHKGLQLAYRENQQWARRQMDA